MKKVLLLLLLLTFSSLSLAQENLDPELIEQIALLELSTEALRALEAETDVPLAFPNRDELRDYISSVFAEAYTPEVLAEETAFYVAFGFVPSDYDLLAGLTELYSQQVAGFYSTDEQSMNVILTGGGVPETALPLLDQLIYVHEYTHALQDQAFDLDTFLQAENDDAYLARLSLIEGDATSVMSLYSRALAEANPLLTLLQLGSGLLQAGNITIPADTPAVIGTQLNFPYIQGQSFVTALITEGGWEMVNTAYLENPPLSSEHILHPESYFAGDIPQSLSLDIALEGWETATSGVFGEFYLREWLKTVGVPRTDAHAAAQGWGGDAYTVLRGADGFAFVLDIAFDSDADKVEFMTAIESLELPSLYIGDTFSCWLGESVLCMAFRDNGLRLSSSRNEDIARFLLNS